VHEERVLVVRPVALERDVDDIPHEVGGQDRADVGGFGVGVDVLSDRAHHLAEVGGGSPLEAAEGPGSGRRGGLLVFWGLCLSTSFLTEQLTSNKY
jgi:hypothetical protein